MIDVGALLLRGGVAIQESRAARLTAWWLLQSPHRAHIAKHIAGATGVVCSLCGLSVEARDPVAARDDDLVHRTCAFGAARLDRQHRRARVNSAQVG